MGKITVIKAKDFKLKESEVKDIILAFQPKIAEREALLVIYEQIIKKEITEEVCEEAGEALKKAVKIRTGIASVHKVQKAYFRQSGLYVDAWKNKETLPVTQMEETLKEMRDHFDIIEQKRLEGLQKVRVALIKNYIDDAENRDLSAMDDDIWEAFLSTKKQDHADLLAAEVQREKDRIAKEAEDKAEKESLRKENKKLKSKIKAVSSEDPVSFHVPRNDAERKNDLISDFEAIKDKYVFDNPINQIMFDGVNTLIGKVIGYINEKYDVKNGKE